jgi:hypothetical protein
MAKTTNNRQRTLLKTKPNKAKVKIGKMNISIVVIKYYDKNNEQSAMNVIQNKAKQSQFQNPVPKERDEKKVSGKLLKKQFYFFMSQNRLIPHYIARTLILREYSRY